MTTQKRGASRKGGASRSSTNGKAPQTFKFKTVTLTRPHIPDTFYWDFGEVQRLVQEQSPKVIGAIRQLLHSLIGDEEIAKLRGVVKNADDEMELLNKLLEESDLDLGEA